MLARHPANLILRFILEIVALVAAGQWGWRAGQGAWRYVLAVGLPLLLAAAWATFAVPGDPSRSGHAPVPIPGRARLVMEGAFFTLAVLAHLASRQIVLAGVFAFAVLLHYFWSAERIAWLLKR
jgi:hypothetical protein